VALGIFVVLVLFREAAIAYEQRGWGLLPNRPAELELPSR
jgi:hypothetical protein